METTAYELIGGEAGIRKLTKRFYELMETSEEGKASRDIHPPSLVNSEQKLFEFLSGWLGGPTLYTDKYGHPMLRRRHMVAPISNAEAESWLNCFKQAWTETVDSPELTEKILPQIEALGHHMKNVE